MSDETTDKAVEDDGDIVFDLVPVRGLETHTFNGLPYQIFRGVGRNGGTGMGDGYCESRSLPDRLLWIHDEPTKACTTRLIEILVHEGLHACLEELPEEKVEEIATDVSRFVRRWLMATSDAARRSMKLKPLAETPDDEVAPEERAKPLEEVPSSSSADVREASASTLAEGRA